jgi:hypothetical protein
LQQLSYTRITSTSIEVAVRDGVAAKEKWLALRKETITKRSRAFWTGSGLPEKALKFEEQVLDILGDKTGLLEGVNGKYL